MPAPIHSDSSDSPDRDQAATVANALPWAAALLDVITDPAMVLDADRRIVADNPAARKLFGLGFGRELGLRPGEALGCEHLGASIGRCGEGEHCKVCGAFRAIDICQKEHVATLEECRVNRRDSNELVPFDLEARCRVVGTGDPPLVLLVLRDISAAKRREVLERAFFHDLLNCAGGLEGLFELLPGLTPEEDEQLLDLARGTIGQLVDEIRAQRDLLLAERGELKSRPRSVAVAPFLDQIVDSWRRQPSFEGRIVEGPRIDRPAILTVDDVLLRRVLNNLIKNALEASFEGQTVVIAFRASPSPRFLVSNEHVMTEEVKLQLFQRSFTTKDGTGRGIGTYSVRLITERYLHGSVGFTSGPGEGTVFTVTLPAS